MSEWEFKKLGKLITLQRGFDITKSQQSEGIYPVISSGGTGSFHNEYKAKGPGVVIGRKGTLGTVFYTESNYWPHSTALWVKDFQGNHPRYIYYFLKTLNLEKLDSGSSNPTLNRNFAHDLDISCPCPLEQQKIADVLSSIDQKIEINNRINAELEALAKTLYDYWFVQFDFPDENGKPYKSSGGKMVYSKELKREIPAGWEAKHLIDVFPISNASLTPSSDVDKIYRYYSIPYFDSFSGYEVEKGGNIGSNKFTVSKGNILVSKLNPWFNRVVFPSGEEDMICSTEFVVLDAESNDLKSYLYLMVKSQEFIAYCINSASGTSNSHKRVNPSVMGRYSFPYNEIILNAFGKKVYPIIQKMENNKKENRELAALRDWLLPMLMNGQVRVDDKSL